MRCSLCGAEFSDGMLNCPACGNFIGRSDSAMRTPPPVYGAQPNYAANFAFSQLQPVKPKMGAVKKALVGTLVIISAIMVALVIIGILADRTKTYDMGSFSIELPTNMEKQSRSEFNESFEKVNAIDTDVYENGRVRFGYAVFNADSSSFGSTNTKSLLSLMTLSLRSSKGFLELESGDDYLKYNVLNDDNKMTYCHLKIKSHNDKCYLLMLVCNEDNQSRFENKFENWLDSFDPE